MKITIEFSNGTKREYHAKREPIDSETAVLRFTNPDYADFCTICFTHDPLSNLYEKPQEVMAG